MELLEVSRITGCMSNGLHAFTPIYQEKDVKLYISKMMEQFLKDEKKGVIVMGGGPPNWNWKIPAHIFKEHTDPQLVIDFSSL